MATIPYVIKKESGSERSYDIFSMLLSERIIFLNEEVDELTSGLIIAQLLHLDNEGDETINFYVKSPGGSVSAGLAIIDTMEFVKSDVSTVCLGSAASMGAMIMAAGTKGKRYILPRSEIMIHQPWGGTEGQVSDIEIQAKRIVRMKLQLENMLADYTGQALETIQADTDRDHWMSASESVEYGIVDKVINIAEIRKESADSGDEEEEKETTGETEADDN